MTGTNLQHERLVELGCCQYSERPQRGLRNFENRLDFSWPNKLDSGLQNVWLLSRVPEVNMHAEKNVFHRFVRRGRKMLMTGLKGAKRVLLCRLCDNCSFEKLLTNKRHWRLFPKYDRKYLIQTKTQLVKPATKLHYFVGISSLQAQEQASPWASTHSEIHSLPLVRFSNKICPNCLATRNKGKKSGFVWLSTSLTYPTIRNSRSSLILGSNRWGE